MNRHRLNALYARFVATLRSTKNFWVEGMLNYLLACLDSRHSRAPENGKMQLKNLGSFWLGFAIIAIGISNQIHAQSQSTSPGMALGETTTSPERLSGVWETSDGSNGVVGLHFMLTTTIAGAAKTLAGVSQTVESLSVGVFQRKGPELRLGDENNFSVGADSGVSWDGKHLAVKWVSRVVSDPAIDIDLIYDKDRQTWSGLFHRGAFSERVTLRRPAVNSGQAASPLTGTWASSRRGVNGCVHVVQDTDGTLAGWSDDLQLTGLYHYANGLKPPQQSFERYGDLVKVKQTGTTSFSIEFKAYTAMCCSHTYVGTISDDGLTLNGGWQAGPNQTPMNLTWKKKPGDSCVGQEE